MSVSKPCPGPIAQGPRPPHLPSPSQSSFTLPGLCPAPWRPFPLPSPHWHLLQPPLTCHRDKNARMLFAALCLKPYWEQALSRNMTPWASPLVSPGCSEAQNHSEMSVMRRAPTSWSGSEMCFPALPGRARASHSPA